MEIKEDNSSSEIAELLGEMATKSEMNRRGALKTAFTAGVVGAAGMAGFLSMLPQRDPQQFERQLRRFIPNGGIKFQHAGSTYLVPKALAALSPDDLKDVEKLRAACGIGAIEDDNIAARYVKDSQFVNVLATQVPSNILEKLHSLANSPEAKEFTPPAPRTQQRG